MQDFFQSLLRRVAQSSSKNGKLKNMEAILKIIIIINKHLSFAGSKGFKLNTALLVVLII